MEQVDLILPHPKSGADCRCTVWITSRHAAGEAASVSWRATVEMAGQAAQTIGPRNTSLMAGALLLPVESLARALLDQALGANP